MERRENIGDRLGASVPGGVRAPEGLRGRIEAAIGETGPGRERVAGPGGGAVRAGAAAVLMLAVGAGLWGVVGWQGGGETAAPGGVPIAGADPVPVVEPAPAVRGPSVVVNVSATLRGPDPLTTEAHRFWNDLNRFRATVEGPVRSLHDLGKSL